MVIMEALFMLLIVVLSVLVGKSDLQEGKVYNKTLMLFGLIGLGLDFIYYGMLNPSMRIPFIINVFVVSVASLVLFYSHSLAGGDSKLLMIMALLYPAGCYISYNRSLITLVFAIGFAVFYGYVYLLATSVFALIKKKNRMSMIYIKGYLNMFIRSFFIAMVYISAITLMLRGANKAGIEVSVWVIRILCILISWLTGKYAIFKKRYVLCGVIVADMIMSLHFRMIPFSIHPENYILVVALLICQMTIRTSLYQEIDIEDVAKGMILSVGSSILMQNSRVRGLPSTSSENLSNRLTEDEVNSIKRWAKGRNIKSITIVKKIPFALFIALGFITYYIVWGLLAWS